MAVDVVHERIARQARRAPGKTAVESADGSLTYAALLERADRLAGTLAAAGVGPETTVGLLVERSLDMVVGLLGILRAGGAYVPLDPDFPQERLAHMVADSGMRVLVSHRGLERRLSAPPRTVVRLDGGPDPGEWKGTDTDPAQLAYILYTSGSTGAPKGVEVTHAALFNFMQSMQRAPGFTAGDTLLAVTTLSFDIAGLEIFLPLFCGGQVVIASRDEARDPRLLAARIETSGCTVMQATPGTWQALVESGWKGSPLLRILCGGEALSPELCRELLPRCGSLWNMYGPTETTIWSTLEHVTETEPRVSIGRPIAETEVLVLDADRAILPPGQPGELYIGGAGLARGYRGQEALTRERFVPHPIRPGGRLYRTGDVGLLRPDGRFDCLGRIDHQIKVRGYRIEPAEIEGVLKRDPDVTDAVVIAREDTPGNKRVVAYVVATEPPGNLAGRLLESVRGALPDYMVPSAFVVLGALPRTLNGKVDRQALPRPEENELPMARAVGPRTATEAMVLRVFREVVGRENFGIFENFFDLGGHSLLAARLMTRLRAEAGVNLPLRELFARPTPAALARAIDAPGSGESIEGAPRAIVPLESRGDLPPVFGVPCSDGDVFCYGDFVRQLGGTRPFFGLEPPGLDGHAAPLLRVEDLAAYFEAQIAAFRPAGPLIVAGFYAGGAVAFELGRRLVEAGRDVLFLALFGSPYPSWYRGPTQVTFRLGQHAKALLSSPGESLRHVTDSMQRFRSRREAASAAGIDPVLTRREALDQVTLRAVRNYKVRSFSGRLALFVPHRAWLPSSIPQWRAAAGETRVYAGPADSTPHTMLAGQASDFAALFRQACGEHETQRGAQSVVEEGAR